MIYLYLNRFPFHYDMHGTPPPITHTYTFCSFPPEQVWELLREVWVLLYQDVRHFHTVVL